MGTEVVDEPATAATEQVEESTTAEAEADFLEAFGSDEPELTTAPTDTEPPAIVDPIDTPETAAPVAVPEPEFVQLTKAQHQELVEGAAQLRAALGQLEGKAFGKMGELQRTLKQMQEATPQGQAVEISAADFKELSEQFPEVAEMQIAGLGRVLAKMKGTGPAIDESRIDAMVNERTQKVREESALEAMDLVDETWRTTVHSPEYKAWLSAQPEAYRQKMDETWKPSDVKKSITTFRAAQAAKPKPKAPKADPAALRRQRFEDAVVAPSSGGQPQGKSANDEFLEGFNSA